MWHMCGFYYLMIQKLARNCAVELSISMKIKGRISEIKRTVLRKYIGTLSFHTLNHDISSLHYFQFNNNCMQRWGMRITNTDVVFGVIFEWRWIHININLDWHFCMMIVFHIPYILGTQRSQRTENKNDWKTAYINVREK